MKSIMDFINESSNKDKWFRFIFKDFDDSNSIIKSIMSKAYNLGIYSEEIDGGVKVRITDKNFEKGYDLLEVIVDYVNMHMNDTGKEHAVQSLQSVLGDMQDFIEDLDNDKE